MQHIDKIEKFFEFLEEHLESGFEKIKRTYSLRYYDEFFDATLNDNTNKFILVNQGGYIETDTVTGNEEYFDEDIHLNPVKQIKRVDIRKQGENKIIKSYEVSLYNDLYKFYQNEFRKFKKNIKRFLLINSLNGDNKHFLETFIKVIKDFQEQAEKSKFSVQNKNCKDVQLLSMYLQLLIDEIKGNYSNNISLSPTVEPNNIQNNTERENLFNGIPVDTVKNYFKDLTSLSNNGKPHLTNAQLDKFIEIAFLKYDVTNPPQKKIQMNFVVGEISKIRKIFYNFYSVSLQHESTRNKKKYIELLTNYFEGFVYKKIADNFSR